MVKDNPKTQPKKTAASKKSRSAIADVVAREYTIHLHKRVSFAPSARTRRIGKESDNEKRVRLYCDGRKSQS